MEIWPEHQYAAIDYESENAENGKYIRVDATRITACGQSCGGAESHAWNVARVNLIGIVHFELQIEAETVSILAKLQNRFLIFIFV